MTSRTFEIELSVDQATVTFRRRVDAPRELVFDAWTQPEHLRHWWGPRDLTLVVCEADLRVGGSYRLVQRAADGHEHGFSGRYVELDRPRRLSRTFVYDGAPDEEALETVSFECEGPATWVASESIFTSFAARDVYTHAGMQHGLRDSQRRLDRWLDTIQRHSDGRPNG